MPVATGQGSLKKLTITSCSVDTSGKLTLDSGAKDQFKVMINPETYEHTHKISYNEAKNLGQTGTELKFSGTEPGTFGFTIIVDGSGVVNDFSDPRGVLDVNTQLGELNDVVYRYDGLNHEPNVVRLLWGSMIFYGRLTALKMTPKLFKPSGEPLRATVRLDFKEFVTNEEESLKAKRSSPDLTHMVEVKSGDTLPLLCNRIYKDCSYYLAVAEVNGINHFRDIKPGQKLYFPPLS